MAFGWSKANFSPIAIDFGGDSLKLLQLAEGDPPKLLAAASSVVPESARHEPRARQAFYAAELKRLLKVGGFKGKRAMLSLPAYQTLTQHMQLDRADTTDLDSQVAIVLRNRLSVDSSRMVIRSAEVGLLSRDGTQRREVICMAASRDIVMQNVAMCNALKLDVVGIHCEQVATLEAFAHMFSGKADHHVCFLDMGAITTKVLITDGEQMVFAKNIHAGGDHFTRQVASDYQVDFMKAREMRIGEAAGVPMGEKPERQVEIDAGGGGLSVLAAQIAAERNALKNRRASEVNLDTSPAMPGAAPPEESIDETLDCLIDELRMCLRYHHGGFPTHDVKRLVFVGGESRHVTHCQKVARTLRIGAQLGDPLARIDTTGAGRAAIGIDLEQPQPGWSVAMGLCLAAPNL